MAHADGFLPTMPTAKPDEYRALAGTVWKEYDVIVELRDRQEA